MRRLTVLLWVVLLPFFLPAAARGEEDGADAEYRTLLEAFKANEHERALDLAERFLAGHPGYRYDAAVKYMAGSAALSAGRYEAAVDHLRRMLADHPEYKMAGAARDGIAVALSRSRRLEECIDQCRANLEAAPKDRRAEKWRYTIAECLFRLWRFPEAKQAFGKLLADYPGSSFAERAKGYLARIDPGWSVDERGIVRGYDGKYANDVRLRAAMDRLAVLRKEAWGRIEARLGVAFPKRADVVFVFEDADSEAESGLRGSTFAVSIDGRPATAITFYTEYVVLSPEEFEGRVVHEMTHAAMREAMGQPYLSLPKWVREGLALHAAGQTEDRVRAILGDAAFRGAQPEALLDGVASPTHDMDDYLEDALAFEWLDAQGPGKLAAFCGKILAGASVEESLAAACGMPAEAVLRAMDAHCRARVEAEIGPAGREYLALRAAKDEAGLKAWLAANPGHALAPNARYRVGKALALGGAGAEGRALLSRVVTEDFPRTSIADDAAYWIARSFEADGDEAGARRVWGVFRRDFSWSRLVAKVPERYAAAGPETGRKDGK